MFLMEWFTRRWYDTASGPYRRAAGNTARLNMASMTSASSTSHASRSCINAHSSADIGKLNAYFGASAWVSLLFQQIDIALKNQWLRQNRNFLSVSLTY